MNVSYYDENKKKQLLKDIRFYECCDLGFRLFVAVILFLFLLWLGSITLAILSLAFSGAVLLFSTALRWGLWKFVHYFSFGRGAPSQQKKFGRYKVSQLRSWLDDLRVRMDLRSHVELRIYDGKSANAFAWQERSCFLRRKNEIVLYSNVLYLLEPDELKALLCHELGHHKHYPRVSLIGQFVFCALSGKPSYRWCLEHLSDWYAADCMGVVAACNALLKLRHRGYVVHEINKRLQFVQKDFKIGFAGKKEFCELVQEVVPHELKDEESSSGYMVEIIDRYFKRRSSAFKNVGVSYVRRYHRSKERKAERTRLSRYFKKLDWRAFDTRVRDNTLDEHELEKLYLHLKGEKKARLFFSYVFRGKEMERWESHPPLRERLIFMVESCVSFGVPRAME